jgi:hypothetical protein
MSKASLKGNTAALHDWVEVDQDQEIYSHRLRAAGYRRVQGLFGPTAYRKHPNKRGRAELMDRAWFEVER